MAPTRAERKQLAHWRGVRSRIMIEFADILAVILIGAFLWVAWEVISGRADIELLRIFSPIVITVVGGYFVEQGIREFRKPPPPADPPPYREEDRPPI